MKNIVQLSLFLSLNLVKFTFGKTTTTNCYSVSCDSLEGQCSDKSDLEYKITLSDNCCKLLCFQRISGEIRKIKKKRILTLILFRKTVIL